jgi:hypothetical protein
LSREFCDSRESSLLVFVLMRSNNKSTARSAGALLRKEKAMVTIKVKGGTPQGSETLCRTCSYGHIIKGFRATEEEVFCRYFYLEREIHSLVSACTFYEDRRLASKREMEDIAWILRTDMPRRRVGFISPEQLRALEAEAAVLPAANDPALTKE